MNVYTRGIRNAFRNGIRTTALVGMLGLSIGLALAMLLAHQAIGQKIKSVQGSVGNTIAVAPVGIRGFQGGGTPLTNSDVDALKNIAHVTSVDKTLTDRLTSSSTSLTSAIDPSAFGGRQFHIELGGGSSSSSDGNADTPSGPGDGNAPPMSMAPPIMVTGVSNPASAATRLTGGSATLTAGKYFDGTKDAAVAIVGKDLAAKNNLSVGSTFTAYGATFTVAGIVDTGSSFSNNVIDIPLPTLQRLSSQAGAVTAATVHIDSATNLTSTTAAIKNKLGSKADVSNDADNAQTTLNSLENIRSVAVFSMIGAAATAAVIILLTMVMIVRERRREIGVLKAIGGSNLTVMTQFITEAITLTILAAAVGIVIGSVAATPVTKMLANNSANNSQTAGMMSGDGPNVITNMPSSNAMPGGGFRHRLGNNSVGQGIKNIQANVNASILLYGFGGAILIAAIGSTAAAGLIAKVRPAEVMRVE